MQQTEPFTDPQELKAFISKLYVYLVDEMHVALNKVTHTHTICCLNIHNICMLVIFFVSQIYSDDTDDDSPDLIQLSSSQLRHFAREAQLTGDYQQADQCYQEVQ